MNAPESRIEIPAVAGTPFAGGFQSGRFFVGAVAYLLIVAPKAEGDFDDMPWNKSRKNVAGAISYNDGLADTLAMASAGSELAQRCLDLRIGGYDDWYLMSRQEALMARCELANVDAFKDGGVEAFKREWYWTSTQHESNPDYAWCQGFATGYQYDGRKGFNYRARAVRRLPI